MPRLPSRFRRLDEILGDLPIEDPMLLSELDGYLTGIVVCPVAIPSDAWLPPIWGGMPGEGAPFEDPLDVRLFAEMVMARHAEIVRDLTRGRPQPLFDIDERNGDVLWDSWIDGFGLAIDIRPDDWPIEAVDADAATSLAYLATLIEIARDTSDLESIEINVICDEAAAAIPGHVVRLHAARRVDETAVPALGGVPVRIGRNDPCPCGSGQKYKRCCAP